MKGEFTFEEFLEWCKKEDIRDGDHTSLSCINEDTQRKARLIVKDEGVIAGIELAKRIFHYFDKSFKIETLIEDGEKVKFGDIAFTIEGSARNILTTERLVLNCMQRMSGIATLTRKYVEKIQDLNTKVLDTRKTTPGFRFFEKEAVKIGGGTNHRYGLYDMIMIKDNHVDYAGGIQKAIDRTVSYLKNKNLNLRIEIETRNLEEVDEVLSVGQVHRIMLDNFDLENTKKAVDLIGGQFETESSGGINLETIRGYAECGVDYVSVGALTHQIKSLDMSLKAF
jgi:nicotinate-nucleotide pyrophosphorylase (carboxylating)